MSKRLFLCAAAVTALAVNPSNGSIAVSIADGTSVVARDPHSGIELIRLLHPAQPGAVPFPCRGAARASSPRSGSVVEVCCETGLRGM